LRTLALVCLCEGMNISPIHAPSRTLSDHFTSIIEGILRALTIERHVNRLWGPLLNLVGNRMNHARRLFNGLAERIRDGWRPAVARARQRVVAPRPISPQPGGSAVPAVVVPRQSGWVIQMAPQPHLVAYWRLQLEEMLVDPEMIAVVTDVPQMGRALRPLCHMLAIKLPAWLALPERPRKPRVEKAIPENETDAEADRRVARMSEKAFINMLTPETEFLKGRPPHRIGYGRSAPWLSRLPKRS
jgi:hypothetical protein